MCVNMMAGPERPDAFDGVLWRRYRAREGGGQTARAAVDPVDAAHQGTFVKAPQEVPPATILFMPRHDALNRKVTSRV